MQKAFDKMSVKTVVNHRPQLCAMCGDKGHSYEHCPHEERDEEIEEINYLNNKPSYFLRSLFNKPSSSNNSCNFYNNTSFDNSNNHPFQSDPPELYIAPAVSDFMHEQRKINQMIFEQMQVINAQSKIINMQMAHLATFNQPPPYRPPIPFPQRLVEPETCCAVNMVDQLTKGQHREGYESSVKNYPDYLSELQVETSEMELVYAAGVRLEDLESEEREPLDKARAPRYTICEPHGFDASRIPQSKGQNIGERESNLPDAGPSRNPSASDADRVTVQIEVPTSEFKPLPANFRYEFLDPDKSCPVILNADLNPDRTAMLLGKLKVHISAIGCSIKDLKDMGWIFLLQVFENTALLSDPSQDRTAGLLEDFQTQRTVMGNLIEKLMGMNLAICMHMTLPADDHRHTDRANQHTCHAQLTWSIYYVPWCVKKKKPPDSHKKRMVYPFDTFDTTLHQKPPDPGLTSS